MEIGHRGVRSTGEGAIGGRASRASPCSGTLAAPLHAAWRQDRVPGSAPMTSTSSPASTSSSWPTAWPAAIRAKHADWLSPPSSATGTSSPRYGTTALIPALSLIFRQSAHGIFIAHCYQYSPTHSTFLVECDPQALVPGRPRSHERRGQRALAAPRCSVRTWVASRSCRTSLVVVQRHDHSQPPLEPRQRRVAGRRATYRTLLDRLGNPHGPCRTLHRTG